MNTTTITTTTTTSTTKTTTTTTTMITTITTITTSSSVGVGSRIIFRHSFFFVSAKLVFGYYFLSLLDVIILVLFYVWESGHVYNP